MSNSIVVLASDVLSRAKYFNNSCFKIYDETINVFFDVKPIDCSIAEANTAFKRYKEKHQTNSVRLLKFDTTINATEYKF